jgi:hypothetical protein
MTDGWKSSEFWLQVAVIACATLLLAMDKINSEMWAIVAGVNGGAYVLGRSFVKAKK